MVDNTALKVEGTRMSLIGDPGATAFIIELNPENGLVETKKVSAEDDLSYLLDVDLHEDPAERIHRSRMPSARVTF